VEEIASPFGDDEELDEYRAGYLKFLLSTEFTRQCFKMTHFAVSVAY
jgi:hypothetical protein